LSHYPFDTWILPLKHQASFTLVDSERLWAQSALLEEVLLKLCTALDASAYNLTINDVPRDDEDKE
jgi:UDPglucose--hexose-1-phosphate uridylyltransferase